MRGEIWFWECAWLRMGVLIVFVANALKFEMGWGYYRNIRDARVGFPTETSPTGQLYFFWLARVMMKKAEPVSFKLQWFFSCSHWPLGL